MRTERRQAGRGCLYRSKRRADADLFREAPWRRGCSIVWVPQTHPARALLLMLPDENRTKRDERDDEEPYMCQS